MSPYDTHVVTGAFGFSGKYLAQRLLNDRQRVRTLTNAASRENPFNGRVPACPYDFGDRDKLIKALQGASVLYNNYWVRFNHREFSYAQAVDNSLNLFDAAKQAGIRRIVHISITNPSLDSPFEYFRGKAILEKAIIDSGLSYAILRPAVLFGTEDILINNIAWFLRTFPVFGVFGNGKYKLQPIYVDDLAELSVNQGRSSENVVIDAIGPETFTYRDLVSAIGNAIGRKRPVVSVPPLNGYLLGRLVGHFQRDITITCDEIRGLMAGLLCTDSAPAGKTRLTKWVRENAPSVGRRYRNEMKRRKNSTQSYERL